MKNPLVSAIIPTFNRAQLLEGAVESALHQTYEPLEVIVVDHGSTDETQEIIASFGERVVGVSIGPSGRGGVGHPRNAGLETAKGEYVAFLDDDDLWGPVKIEKQMALFQAKPSLGLVATNAEVIDERGVVIRERYFDKLQLESDVLRQLARDNFVIVSSVLAPKPIVLECGRFDVRPSLFMVEDYHLWLRIAARSDIGLIDETLVRYRAHGGSHAKASSLEALRRRRAVLRAALEDPVVLLRRLVILEGLARDYARSAITLIKGQR